MKQKKAEWCKLKQNKVDKLILEYQPCNSESLFFVREDTTQRTVSFLPIKYSLTGAAMKFKRRSEGSRTRNARIIETYISRICDVDAPEWRSRLQIAALKTFPM